MYCPPLIPTYQSIYSVSYICFYLVSAIINYEYISPQAAPVWTPWRQNSLLLNPWNSDVTVTPDVVPITALRSVAEYDFPFGSSQNPLWAEKPDKVYHHVLDFHQVENNVDNVVFLAFVFF